MLLPVCCIWPLHAAHHYREARGEGLSCFCPASRAAAKAQQVARAAAERTEREREGVGALVAGARPVVGFLGGGGRALEAARKAEVGLWCGGVWGGGESLGFQHSEHAAVGEESPAPLLCVA